MTLSTQRPDLLPVLQAAIAAETDAAFVDLRNAGAVGAMADWCNVEHGTTKAWRSSAQWAEIFDAIDGAKYTPSAANFATQLTAEGTNRLLVNLLKLQVQQNMLLAHAGGIDARDDGNVDALLDTVTAVYTLSGSGTAAPGGASGVNVANRLARAARRGELAFGGTDRTDGTVTAKVLAWEGQLSADDIVQAINWVAPE
jgi:hypothetical protein